MRDGCPNCENVLQLRGNNDAIQECTSQVFEGLISVRDPTASWVARWQRLDNYVAGTYATKVTGTVSSRRVSCLNSIWLTGWAHHSFRNTSSVAWRMLVLNTSRKCFFHTMRVSLASNRYLALTLLIGETVVPVKKTHEAPTSNFLSSLHSAPVPAPIADFASDTLQKHHGGKKLRGLGAVITMILGSFEELRSEAWRCLFFIMSSVWLLAESIGRSTATRDFEEAFLDPLVTLYM